MKKRGKERRENVLVSFLELIFYKDDSANIGINLWKWLLKLWFLIIYCRINKFGYKLNNCTGKRSAIWKMFSIRRTL